MDRSVSNTLIKNRFDMLNKQGVNINEIIKNCKISDFELNNQEDRTSKEHLNKILTELEKHNKLMLNSIIDTCSQDNALNKKYSFYPNLIGICINEESGISALNRFIQNRIVIGNIDDIIITRGQHKTKIEYLNLGPKDVRSYFELGHFITINSIIKNYISTDAIVVGFTENFHDRKRAINDIFMKNCLFNQSQNFMIIDNELLDKKNIHFNPILHSIQKEKIHEETAVLKSNSPVSTIVIRGIEKIIKSTHSNGDIDILNNICSTLNMSRWTLNEKLKNEETSFTEILKSVKLQQACTLLMETEMSIQEISDRVLFSSQSVFSRFFKQNLNISPLLYRNKFNSKHRIAFK